MPILPGVMPVTNVRQIERFAVLSGAAFPADLAARLHAVEDDPVAVREIGVEVATALCERPAGRGRSRAALHHPEPLDGDPRDLVPPGADRRRPVGGVVTGTWRRGTR